MWTTPDCFCQNPEKSTMATSQFQMISAVNKQVVVFSKVAAKGNFDVPEMRQCQIRSLKRPLFLSFRLVDQKRLRCRSRVLNVRGLVYRQTDTRTTEQTSSRKLRNKRPFYLDLASRSGNAPP